MTVISRTPALARAFPSLHSRALRMPNILGTLNGRVVIAFFLAFIMAYLGLANRIIVKGFEATELTRQIASLRQQNADLALKIGQLRGLPAIEEGAKTLQMTAPLSVRYLEPSQGSVALGGSVELNQP